MVALTLITRVSDGLPLAEGLDGDTERQLDTFKQQAKVAPPCTHVLSDAVFPCALDTSAEKLCWLNRMHAGFLVQICCFCCWADTVAFPGCIDTVSEAGEQWCWAAKAYDPGSRIHDISLCYLRRCLLPCNCRAGEQSCHLLLILSCEGRSPLCCQIVSA